MKRTRNIVNCLFCLGLILKITLAFDVSFAAAPKRIALLPFIINSDKDFSFLKGGIFDMLTSRLSKRGLVEVLSKARVEAAIQSIVKSGAINETAALRIGALLNADFVLFGSLTILGNSVSIDTKMVELSGREQSMIFFDQGQELGAFFTIINLIASNINDKIIGSTQIASTAKAPTAESTALAARLEPTPQTELQMAVVPSTKIRSSSEIENVDERTIHRENWLLSQNATYFTIQIMGVHNEQFLPSFINTNQLLKQNEIAYYQSTFNSKVWYSLLYGIYPTLKEAQLAVNKLPENISKAKPWIRNISTVQKAIRDRLKQ